MTLELATAGESHGPALVAIVSGLPAGLVLDREAIDADLRRRQQGYGRSPRQQIETDEVEVLAGLRRGRTLGTPLALVVRNRDHKNWTWGMSPWPPEGEPTGKGTKPVTLPRPGHADLAGAGRDRRRLRARDEPRRRHRGRRVERRGDRRPRSDEAAADVDEAARLGRPGDGRAGPGARRAKRRRGRRGARRRRRGRGRFRARPCGTREVRGRRSRRLRRRLARVPRAHPVATHALNRHLVLVGFMGAGKSTIGVEVARRLGRELVDVDKELEERIGRIDAFFERSGEAAFREVEAKTIEVALRDRVPRVIGVGGGAVETDTVRELLRDEVVVLLDVDVDSAWERARGTDRPLAQDEAEFRRRYEHRQPLYTEVADARAGDADGVILAAAGVHVEVGALERLAEFVDPPAPLVT